VGTPKKSRDGKFPDTKPSAGELGYLGATLTAPTALKCGSKNRNFLTTLEFGGISKLAWGAVLMSIPFFIVTQSHPAFQPTNSSFIGRSLVGFGRYQLVRIVVQGWTSRSMSLKILDCHGHPQTQIEYIDKFGGGKMRNPLSLITTMAPIVKRLKLSSSASRKISAGDRLAQGSIGEDLSMNDMCRTSKLRRT